MTYTELPDQGAVFWPVGTGDSTTIVVKPGVVMQVDLRDQDQADEPGAVVAPVIDRLVETLPTKDDKPYLAVLALTHADLDHIAGFGDLLDSGILIGELWVTPRIWREAAGDGKIGEEAQRVHEEAVRRVNATKKAVEAGREPVSGERIRIIGHDEDGSDYGYDALPDRYITGPGHPIVMLDGEDVRTSFEAFIHAPFKGDCAGERNETSLAMQISLRAEDGTEGRMLLLGDLSYVTIKKIFNYSEFHGRPERLDWDVLLSPHHCSKKVMYAPDENGEDELKQDILNQLQEHAGTDAYVIASSRPFRDADKTGDNPPHLLAWNRYKEIAPNEVVCTGEYPTEASPRPVVFGLTPGVGLELLAVPDDEDDGQVVELARSGSSSALLKSLGLTAAVLAGDAVGVAGVRAAVAHVRGTRAAPAASVGFGWR
jgi:beta-lactamase superfamily II metal-dependent hydrolase